MPDQTQFMREALAEAEQALTVGEVPVGAVVVRQGQIVGRGHNEVEAGQDATAHAEILALRRASATLGRWRLDDCALYVTLEPCSMCIGAMVLARLTELYFAAPDPKQGACGSLFDLSAHPELPHSIKTCGGLLSGESEALLRCFFASLRGS